MHLDVDIEYIIFKIYQCFHICTVLSELLNEYCDFVDIDSKKKTYFPKYDTTAVIMSEQYQNDSHFSRFEVFFFFFVSGQTTQGDQELF